MVPQSSYGGRGIEYYFRAIYSVHHPVLRVMATVTDVDSDSSKLRLHIGSLVKHEEIFKMLRYIKHWMPKGALHVVSRLIKIANSRNVILP